MNTYCQAVPFLCLRGLGCQAWNAATYNGQASPPQLIIAKVMPTGISRGPVSLVILESFG